MKFFYFILGLFILISCNTFSQEEKYGFIEIAELSDSCYVVKSNGNKVKAKREVYISENTATDTFLLGFSVVPPGFTGYLVYLQEDTLTTRSFYINEESKNDLPKTEMFCTHLYQNRNIKGKVRLKYFY